MATNLHDMCYDSQGKPHYHAIVGAYDMAAEAAVHEIDNFLNSADDSSGALARARRVLLEMMCLANARGHVCTEPRHKPINDIVPGTAAIF